MIPLRPKRLITAVAKAKGGVISGTSAITCSSFFPRKFNLTWAYAKKKPIIVPIVATTVPKIIVFRMILRVTADSRIFAKTSRPVPSDALVKMLSSGNTTIKRSKATEMISAVFVPISNLIFLGFLSVTALSFSITAVLTEIPLTQSSVPNSCLICITRGCGT